MERKIPVILSVITAIGMFVSGNCLGAVSPSLTDRSPASNVSSWGLTMQNVSFSANGSDNRSDRTELQNALNRAANGDPNKLYHIVVPAGTYYIDDLLFIYSNTYLELADGATIKKTNNFPERLPMIMNGESGGDSGYNSESHICIQGGTWDSNASANQSFDCCIYLRHCSDIIIKNATFQNCINHMLNVSGSRNVMVDGCTFRNAVRYTGNSAEFFDGESSQTKHRTVEAIHLDFMNREGEPGAANAATGGGLDGTPVKDVTIRNCTFTNVFRGVGTHHLADLSNSSARNYATGYGSNIRILNNTFTNVYTSCCSLCSYSNVEISGNTATNVGSFITAEDVHGLTVSGSNRATLYPTSSASNNDLIQIFRMCGILNSDNVSISGSAFDANHSVDHCIRIENSSTVSVEGCNLSNSKTNAVYVISSSGINIGNDEGSQNVMSSDGLYTVSFSRSNGTIANTQTAKSINIQNSPVTITGCTISSGYINVGENSPMTISNNTINSPSEPTILIAGGTDTLTINNNTLSSGNNNCIYITQHTGGNVTIRNNTFNSAQQNMVYVGEGSNNISISDNTFNGTASTASRATRAVSINNSNVLIRNNRISNFSDDAVIFRNQASGTIEGNTINSCGGISVINGGNFAIRSNNISRAPQRLIYIQNSSGTIAGNTLSDAERNGIELYDCSSVSIDSNTISDMGSESYTENAESNGVRIINCSDISITGNSFSNNRNQNIYYNEGGCSNITISDTPVNTPTPAPIPTTSGEGVDGFVERLYTIALGRSSDPAGQQSWVNTITSGQNTGADVARGFLYSDEFLNKNMTNEDFVRTLYRTFFDREADQGGLAAWVGVLDGGESKQNVIEGFINSTEWANVCVRYGIPSGGTGTPSVEVEPNQQTIDFATRLYTTCLNRNADQGGLMAWARQLANQRDTGTGAARGFFFSSEFTNQNVSNGEYVTRLYRTFMGREPDQAGYDAWVGQLDSGVSREEVFNGFAASQEFTVICGQYGIIRG